MKWQTIVRRLALTGSSPANASGVTVSLKSAATGAVLQSTLSDTAGVATFTLDGVPGPTTLEAKEADVTRYQTSSVMGPDGPANISELRWVAHAIAGATGAGIVPGYGMQLALSPAAGTRTVSVASGQAIIPGGFLYTQYGTQTLALAAANTLPRIDAIVAEADDSETSSTYGRTRLAVVQGSGPANPVVTGARTVLGWVTVPAGASVIQQANIQDTYTQRALTGWKQSNPVAAVFGQSSSSSTTTATSTSTYIQSTGANIVSGLIYDAEGIASVVVQAPTGSSTNIATVLRWISNGSIIQQTGQTHKLANNGVRQTLSVAVRGVFTAAATVVYLELEVYPMLPSTSLTIGGYTLSGTAVPRR